MRLPVPQLPNILTADFNNLPDAVGNVEHALFHHVLTTNKQLFHSDNNKESCKANEVTDDAVAMNSSTNKEATEMKESKPDIYANEPTFANLLAFLCLIQCPLKSSSAKTSIGSDKIANTSNIGDTTTISAAVNSGKVNLSNPQEIGIHTLLHKIEKTCAIASSQITSRQRFTATLYRFAIRSRSNNSNSKNNEQENNNNVDDDDSLTNDSEENKNVESKTCVESSSICHQENVEQEHEQNTKALQNNNNDDVDDCSFSNKHIDYKLFFGKGKTSMNVALANAIFPDSLDITINKNNNSYDNEPNDDKFINYDATERTYYTGVHEGWRSVLTYPLSISDIRSLIISSALNVLTINETDDENNNVVKDDEVVPMACKKFLPSCTSFCSSSVLFDSTRDRSKPVLYHPMEWLHVIGDPLIVRDEPCAKELVNAKKQQQQHRENSGVNNNYINHSSQNKEYKGKFKCPLSDMEGCTLNNAVDSDHHNANSQSDNMTRKYIAVKYTPLRLPLTSRRLYKPFSYGQISRYHIYELQSANHRSASDVMEYFSLLLRQPRVHRKSEHLKGNVNTTTKEDCKIKEYNGEGDNETCRSSCFADGILHFYGTALEPLFIHYIPRRALRFQLAFISPILRNTVIRDYSYHSSSDSDNNSNKDYDRNSCNGMSNTSIDQSEKMPKQNAKCSIIEESEANNEKQVEEEQTCITENEYFCSLCDNARDILSAIDAHVTESVSRIYLQLSAYILSDEWKEPALEIKIYPVDDALTLIDNVNEKNEDYDNVGTDIIANRNSNNNTNVFRYNKATMLQDGQEEEEELNEV